MNQLRDTAHCLVQGKEHTHIALVADPRCASGRLAIYAVVRGIWGMDAVNDYLNSASPLIFTLTAQESLQVAESLQCNTHGQCVHEVQRLLAQPVHGGRYRYWSIIATGLPDKSANYEFLILNPHRWN